MVGGSYSDIRISVLVDGFPLLGMCCVLTVFLGQGVVHVLDGVLPNFRQNPQVSIYFQNLVNLIRRVDYRYSNGLGYLVPCESLDEFRKTGTHSRACGGCHVSTFPGRGVTNSIWILIFKIEGIEKNQMQDMKKQNF